MKFVFLCLFFSITYPMENIEIHQQNEKHSSQDIIINVNEKSNNSVSSTNENERKLLVSKAKIAAISSIISAIITGAITLTIHLTECKS